MKLKIAPSLLAADFARLGEQVRTVEQAGADMLHVDIMDGHFVPNLSMGPMVVSAVRRSTSLYLDVHLMLSHPRPFVEPFVDAGADGITFHVETEGDHRETLDWLSERGIGRGIAVSPATPIERAEALIPHVDMVLVMTVEPGFGGQGFLAGNLDKIAWLRREERRLRGPDALPLEVQVDGGIDGETILRCRDAGASVFVAGTTIFGAADPAEAVGRMRARVHTE